MQLSELQRSTLDAIARLHTLEELEALTVSVLGRKGVLTEQLKELGALSPEERRLRGQEANTVKQVLAAALDAKRTELEAASIAEAVRSESADVTEPVPVPPVGHIHPLTRATFELIDIFARLGFTVVDGPELESEAYNFEALNIPSWHPARDMQDTFHLGKGLVMRTHTSPVQIRAMRSLGAPLSIIAPGRVYRNEATDASHDYVFDQIEGLVVTEDVSLASMATVFRSVIRAFLGRDIPSRLRPGYFPFVEPGVEVDMRCTFCEGGGCRLCKGTGWMEILGAGMIHPVVFEHCGIDPEKYSGFALGTGLDRPAMQRYGIPDLRLMFEGDVRFLSQF